MNATSDTPAQRLQGFNGTLVLVGAGKMGGAMLTGWLELGLDPRRVTVLEPAAAPQLAALTARGLRLNPPADARSRADVVLLAVKPQTAAAIVPGLRPVVGPATLVLSIMAGRTLAFLADALSVPAALVRAMPNTPAAIGRGITVAVPGRGVAAPQRAIADALLAACGAVEWVTDEALLDAVTAVSGSGPAYVFLLAETLAQAGIEAGLPPALAARLAAETVAGAGELLHRASLDPATLRDNVTSPGGTTAAALGVLMAADGMQALMTRAVAAATRRARELAN